MSSAPVHSSGLTQARADGLYARLAAANTFTVAPQTITIDADGHKGLVVTAHSVTQSGAAYQYLASDGTTVLDEIAANGHVGFGTPADPLFVGFGSQLSAGVAVKGDFVNDTAGAHSDYATLSLEARFEFNSDISTNTDFEALIFNSYTPATSTFNASNRSLYGLFGLVAHRGSGSLFSVEGVNAIVISASSAPVDTVRGIYAIVGDGGGVGTGQISNLITCHIDQPFIPNPAHVTASYGLLCEDLSGTGASAWNVYSKGATAHNYFAGPVGVGNDTPDASAKVQIDSTTQGLAPPRGTTTQKNAISSPLESLIFYDTTLHAPYFWNGSAWTAFGGGTGTVTAVSVASANGFAGSSSGGATPALTLTTTVTGVLLGNGTTISASSVTNDVQTKAAIVPNTAPAAGQLLAGNAGGTAYAPVTLSGSGATFTLSSAGLLTVSAVASASLASTTVTASSYGDASHVATFTVNAQGQLTAAASVSIAIAAGAVSGLATIATSGAITDATGTLLVTHGGTGLATLTIHALYVGNGTSAPTALAVGATNTVLHGSTGADPSFSAVTASDFGTQSANTALHGPASGSAATPTFRLQLPADLPHVVTSLADAATVTVNWSLGKDFDIAALTASRTIAFSNDFDGGAVLLRFASGGTGAFTPVWPATVKWQGGVAPTLTNASGKYDHVSIVRWGSGDYMGSFAPAYS